MWSGESLVRVNKEAYDQEEARRSLIQPYQIKDPDEISWWPPYPFPDLVGWTPEGWEEAGTGHCPIDPVGRGEYLDWAMTWDEFKVWVRSYLVKHPDHGFGISKRGESIIYIQAYRRK
jgi:hypothetical protein